MKNLLHKIKPIIFSFLWFLLGVWFVVFISSSNKAQQNIICSDAHVEIDYDKGDFFVGKSDIKKMIANQLPDGKFNVPVKAINLEKVEQSLEDNPYIADAEVYIDINGQMWVNITQRHPILRIINTENNSYYVSDDGEKMPITVEFASRVPIATGNIQDNNNSEGQIQSPVVEELYQLAKFVDKKPFWKAQIEQIYINDDSDIILVPKLGNHEIIFGHFDEKTAEDKLEKLMIFYKEGLANVGWSTYNTINVKYKNQIVCTKK